MDVLAVEALEQDDVVDAIQEFWCKGTFQCRLNHAVAVRGHIRLFRCGAEAHTCAEFGQLARTDVGRHDDDGVAEIHLAAQAVCQLSIVQGLKQEIEDVWVCLFNLVEQHDGVGATTHFLGQLTAFLVPDVARRCPDQACDGKLLHVLGHVDANQGFLRIEHELRKDFGELRFADARGAKENEGTDGFVGVLEACAVALDGFDHLFDRFFLTNDLAFKIGVHAGELAAFLLGNALDRNACHHGHDITDVILGDRDTVVLGIFFPSALGLLELLVQDAFLVAQPRGLFVALGTNHTALLVLDVLDFFFNLDDFLWHVDVGQVHAAAHLVQSVDGLVRKVTVGDVPARERHTRRDGGICVLDTVVLLVFVFDVVEDLHRLLDARRLDHDLLEATFQGAIFFDVLTVFIQGGGTNALDLSTRECRLEHVGSVQRTACASCANDGVDFVDEQNDVRRLFQLIHHRLHAFLKLTSVLGACHQRSDVQRDNAFVEQHTADLFLHDAEGQTFCNCTLSHAGFSHQDGVVLFAAAQDLTDTLNFLGASHNGVQTAFLRHAGEISSKIVQDRCLGFGVAFARRGTSGTSGATKITAALGGGVVVGQRVVSAGRPGTAVV